MKATIILIAFRSSSQMKGDKSQCADGNCQRDADCKHTASQISNMHTQTSNCRTISHIIKILRELHYRSQLRTRCQIFRRHCQNTGRRPEPGLRGDSAVRSSVAVCASRCFARRRGRFGRCALRRATCRESVDRSVTGCHSLSPNRMEH